MKERDFTLELTLLHPSGCVAQGQHKLSQRPAHILLLSFLSLAPQPPSRHQLAELFWPQEPLHAKRLKQLSNVFRLLRQLHPELIQEAEDVAHIRCHPQLWCDVHALHQAYALHDLQAVIQLHKAPLLADMETQTKFPLTERQELGQWLQSERDYLMGMMVRAGLELAEGEALRGEWHTAALWAEQLCEPIDLAPLSEDVYERLYRILLAANTAPTAPLLKKLKRILHTQEAQALIPQGTEQARAQLAHKHNITQPPLLIGRRNELHLLQTALLNPDIRLVSLVGMPGVGKTHLARQVSYTLLGRQAFRKGVYWLSLETLKSLEEVCVALAHILGVTLLHNQDIELLLQALEPQARLLIFDSCEHLLSLGSFMEALLKHCPEVKILITSRQPLQLDIETVYILKGLAYPTDNFSLSLTASTAEKSTPLTISKQLTTYPAIHLFYRQAQHTKPGFRLTLEQWPNVLDICQGVEGSPLALILAASCLQHLSCKEIAEQVRDSVVQLEKRLVASQHQIHPFSQACELDHAEGIKGAYLALGAPKEAWESLEILIRPHHSIVAACDLSWQLLSPKERQSWCRLSVCEGGFTHEAAKEVVGVSVVTLHTLVNKSLLMWQGKRYSFHPVLHHYAQEKLAQDPEMLWESRTAHAHYYLNVDDKGRWVLAEHVLIAETPNIVGAWRWCVETGQYMRLSRALYAIEYYFTELLSRLEEGAELIYATLRALTPLQTSTQLTYPPTPFEMAHRGTFKLELFKAHLQIILAEFSCGRLNRSKCEELLAKALPVVKEHQDTYWQSRILNIYGFYLIEDGELEKSSATLQKALQLPALPEQYVLIYYCNLTRILQNLGQLQKARICLHRAYNQLQSQPHETSYVLYLAGQLSLEMGDFERARGYFLKSIDAAQHYHNKQVLIFNHDGMALLYTLLNNADKAYAHVMAGIALVQLQPHHNHKELLRLKMRLASVYVAHSALQEAITLIEHIWQSTQTMTPRVAYRLLGVLLEVWCQQKNYPSAYILMQFLLTPEHKRRCSSHTKRDIARTLRCHRRDLKAHKPPRSVLRVNTMTLSDVLVRGPSVFELSTTAHMQIP